MKIYIHPIVYVLFLIAFLTGMFMEIIVVFTLVFIHELGHFLAAKYFGWRIRVLKLWFFGGVMETDEHFTRPLHEELIVTISGPVQHLWIFLFLISFGDVFFSESLVNLIHTYNGLIFLFNVLPIYPLDGGKLLQLAHQFIVPFQRAHIWTLMTSVSAIVVVFTIYFMFLGYNLSLLCLFSFLLVEIVTEWRHRKYSYLRFLLKRTTSTYHYRKTEMIFYDSIKHLQQSFRSMYRFRNHLFKKRNSEKRLTEQQILKKYFFKAGQK